MDFGQCEVCLIVTIAYGGLAKHTCLLCVEVVVCANGNNKSTNYNCLHLGLELVFE